MLEQRNDNLCKTHLGEKLKYICLTENKKICSECAKKEEHKEHNIKKIKTLKGEGAKIKGELQQSFLNMKKHELQEEKDCEEIKKVFIKTIDKQFKEIQEILVEKQFELLQQTNKLFIFNKNLDSKKLSKLKQEMDQNIKNITQISNEEGGDMVLLDNALSNAQVKPEFLKEKSSKVQNKLREMQNVLTGSLTTYKTGINSLELSNQELMKEICSGDQEEQQKLTQKLKSEVIKLKTESIQLKSESIKPKSESIVFKSERMKFKSYFDVINHTTYLEISATRSELKEIEIDARDFQAHKSIFLSLKCYDTLQKEPNQNPLTFLLNKLQNLSTFEALFAQYDLKNDAVLWVANTIRNHFRGLRHLHLNFGRCKMNDKFIGVLCNEILSKIPNLDTIGLYFSQCRVRNQDLYDLLPCLNSFQKNLSALKLHLNYTTGSANDNGLCELLQMLPSREKLQTLSLDLQGGLNITDKSLEKFGAVLPSLKGLKDLTVYIDSRKFSEKGIWTFLKNLANLKKRKLNFSYSPISDQLMKRFVEEVLSKIGTLEEFNFIAEKRAMNYATLKMMLQSYSNSNQLNQFQEQIQRQFNSKKIN